MKVGRDEVTQHKRDEIIIQKGRSNEPLLPAMKNVESPVFQKQSKCKNSTVRSVCSGKSPTLKTINFLHLKLDGRKSWATPHVHLHSKTT